MTEGGPYTAQALTALIFLASAAVIVLASRKFHLSSVVGFLIAGVLFGPNGALNHLFPTMPALMGPDGLKGVNALAEIGVIFLLFAIGLELSPRRLWDMRRMVIGLGSAQILVSAIIIAGLVSIITGPWAIAFLIGLSLALSSTAMVMPILLRSAQFVTPHGRAIFGVLLAQDLAVVPILFFASTLGGDGVAGANMAPAVLKGLGTILAIIVAGLGVRRLFRAAARTGQRELFLAMALLTIGGAAAATEAVGLKAPLGAFLAGLVLADTEFRHQLDVEMEPLKDLLLGLFFFSVGLSLNAAALAADLPLLLLGLIGLILLKGLVAYGLARAFGGTVTQAVRTAFGLACAGEFVFVILGQASKDALIEVDAMQYMQALAGLSLMVTPLMLGLGARLAERIGRGDHDSVAATMPDGTPPVFIAGFGRVGQTIAGFLERFGIAYVAVDSNVQLVKEQRAQGRALYFGDATRQEFLHKLHLDGVQVAVITVDDGRRGTHILDTLRSINPAIESFVRAGHVADMVPLREHGAAHVVPDTIESSMQLAKAVCGHFDIAHESVAPLIDRVRRTDYDLQALKEDG